MESNWIPFATAGILLVESLSNDNASQLIHSRHPGKEGIYL